MPPANQNAALAAPGSGRFDIPSLLAQHFTPRVPWLEWAARRHYGATLDTSQIESVIRYAEVGIMYPMGDLIRETLSLNPAATSFLGRAFTPLAMADYDVQAAEGDGLDLKVAKAIASDVSAQIRNIRGFRQSLLDLAWGFSDGRAALEKEMVQTSWRPAGVDGASSRPLVVRLHSIPTQRVSFDEDRELIIVERTGDSGMFRKRGPALSEIRGKFVQFTPRMFGDLQEREGLAPRFLYWLLFDRFQWRRRLEVMQKMGTPITSLEQELAKSLDGMRMALPGANGGEGGAPNNDKDYYSNAMAELQAALDAFGIFIGRPGERLEIHWPPADVHQLFTDGSDQILRHLEMIALHAALSSASTEQTRSGLVVLKTDQETLLDFRGMLVADAIREDLVRPMVEMGYGVEAAQVYTPTFALRTSPIRDRGAEIDRLVKISAMVPVGVGSIYEASGFHPPSPGEPLVTPPAPPAPPGQGGPTGSGTAPPAVSRDEGPSGAATGALQDQGEAADEDEQGERADIEARMARWFAAPGRLVQPSSANGSPESLIERGVREGARITSAWAAELLDAADGNDPDKIYRRLERAGGSLNVEPFVRAWERRAVHGAMLGGIDADHEMAADVTIAPVHFDLAPPPKGVADFATMPFGEAIRAFTSKRVVPKATFDRMIAAAKRRAFTVAHLARVDMIKVAHDELGKALAGGDDLRDFGKALAARFDAAGWTRLNPSHVETVFRNGVMGAYANGRTAQMMQPSVLAARPYGQILGVDDARTRKPHAAAHTKVLSQSDPFWDRAGPPFGHQCRCRRVSRSGADLERLGLAPTIGAALTGLPDEGWDASGSLL